MKKLIYKLGLNKLTISNLNNSELTTVVGGIKTITGCHQTSPAKCGSSSNYTTSICTVKQTV